MRHASLTNDLWSGIFIIFLASLYTWISQNHPFFWDTVQLASKHAHWYYENGFQYFWLPQEIDSGHPPTFGMYLAACWTFLGRSLPVSHWAMWPFLVANFWLIYKLGTYYTDKITTFGLLFLFIADPVLSGQSVLVSPDIPLLTFFLLGIYAILNRYTFWKVVAIIGLVLLSMRGMMVVLALFLFDSINTSFLTKDNSKFSTSWFKVALQKVPAYLPGGLLALIFLFFHYAETGWIGYHADSPWAPSFERVGVKGFFRNLMVLGWRMVDFGRVFLWVILMGILWQWWKKKHSLGVRGKQLWMLFFICLLTLSYSILLYRYLSGHRYLLPIYATLHLLVFYYLFVALKAWVPIVRWVLLGIIIIGLASGNFWIYPRHISQGWDATLAHLPYYNLREKMLEYLAEEKIPLNQIGSGFPNIGPRKYIDLNNDTSGFSRKDFHSQNYILYSNIMNDFTDKELKLLEREWGLVKQLEKNGIVMELYRRR